MEIGIVGLGRMGANISNRLVKGGHRVVGYDRSDEVANRLKSTGIEESTSLNDLVDQLAPPQIIWLMIPAGEAVDTAIDELIPLVPKSAIFIDGGNSNYKDTLRRHAKLSKSSIFFIDVGTSGGLSGGQFGYCMMIGGDTSPIERLRPIFETLAPEVNKGWARVGPAGAGHFVKMIHNGIEYGMMQAYAEGFSLLREKKEFNLDLEKIAQLWNHGSLVRSWLLDLVGKTLSKDQDLNLIGAHVEDSGEGRWALQEAVDLNVAAPIITLSLLARLQSRDPKAFSNKLLAALRQEFGGHDVLPGE